MSKVRKKALVAERDRLRKALAFYADVHKYPSPLTGGMGAMRSDVAIARLALLGERDAVRAAWLRVIQAENSCAVTGRVCNAKRCDCAAEQDMLIKKATP